MKLPPSVLMLRAYHAPPKKRAELQRAYLDEPSSYALIFDCETTTTPDQSLRIGSYQVRKDCALIECGVFYEPNRLTAAELALLTTSSRENGAVMRTVEDFLENVFWEYGYDLGGIVVGFNLAFDLSRLASRWATARAHKANKMMRGGFSFRLSRDGKRPGLRIRKLSSTLSLFDFACPWEAGLVDDETGEHSKPPKHPGYFIELRSIAAALTSRKHTLASLCRAVKTRTQKSDSGGHGQALTREYLAYAANDVQATWECYQALKERYDTFGLPVPLHRIASEASIGKALFKAFGVQPQSDFDSLTPERTGQVMSTLYGGRTEVRLRKQITECQLYDFTSMYPTQIALQGLWRFMIAQGLIETDATDWARLFVEHIRLEDMQRPENWALLNTLVRIHPNDDVLPVRMTYEAKLDEDQNPVANPTIGLNVLRTDFGVWYTLADVIASKLFTGRAPRILEAVRFDPGPAQEGLVSVQLLGRDDAEIDPATHDAILETVRLRRRLKAANDPLQLNAKIIANACGYGNFIQINLDRSAEYREQTVYGHDGTKQTIKTTVIEEPGPLFHPVVATFITGGARLMMAAAELVAADEGLDWMFCDTDSFAFARGRDQSRTDFLAAVERVAAWFTPLDPYARPGEPRTPILKAERENFSIDDQAQVEPLYAVAISSKRYCLFNLDPAGQPVIRKASQHGLGHLVAPYGDDDPPESVPAPVDPDLKVKRWEHDLWWVIAKAHIDGHPNLVRLDYHPALAKPAASPLTLSTPELLRRMDKWNADKDPIDQARPFSFMLQFFAHRPGTCGRATPREVEPGKRGRPKKRRIPKPVAPFEKTPSDALPFVFDRETGDPVPADELRTYENVLNRYHRAPEAKFENGGAFDSGRTERRHVDATDVAWIGKETNALNIAARFTRKLNPLSL